MDAAIFEPEESDVNGKQLRDGHKFGEYRAYGANAAAEPRKRARTIARAQAMMRISIVTCLNL